MNTTPLAENFIIAFNKAICDDITNTILYGEMTLDQHMNKIDKLTKLLQLVDLSYVNIDQDARSLVSANTFINSIFEIMNKRIEEGDSIMIENKFDHMFKMFVYQTGMWTDGFQLIQGGKNDEGDEQ